MLEPGSGSFILMLLGLLSIVVPLVILILCGYFSAKIMKSKGRSEGVGWALGLLLPLIGLLIVALLPSDEEGVNRNLINSGIYMKCPFCRKTIDKQASICPYCQSHLK